MKVIIHSNFSKLHTEEILDKVERLLKLHNVNILYDDDTEESIKNCDFIITIGGDGTIIHHSKNAALYNKPILGINTGRVGFLTELEKEAIEALNLPGIDFIEEKRRYYPNSSFASYTLGYAKNNEEGKIVGEFGLEDLLDDVNVEMSQAIEMANIYASVLSGTMDTFASLISNNLNTVMKVLTSITILMAIPTMVFSFFGMNIGPEMSGALPLADNMWFVSIFTVAITAIVGIILYKKVCFNQKANF